MIALATNGNAQRLEGKFKLCDTENKVMVETKLNCKTDQFVNMSTSPEQELWHLLSKQTTRIRGKAFICKKFIVEAITDTGFFGHETLSMLSFPQSMSSNECETMIKTKKCEGQNMVCNDNTCYYQVNPIHWKK